MQEIILQYDTSFIRYHKVLLNWVVHYPVCLVLLNLVLKEYNLSPCSDNCLPLNDNLTFRLTHAWLIGL